MASAAAADTGRAAVLQSCGILFLFRAWREAVGDSRGRIETQLLDSIMDFTGATGGAVLVGSSAAALREEAAERTGVAKCTAQRGVVRDKVFDLESIAGHVGAGNGWVDEESATAACPIHERGRVAGMIFIWFGESLSRDELESRFETLTGIAMLAGLAFESSEIAGPPKPEAAFDPVRIPGVIAESPAMQRVLRLVQRVAPAEATVLIEGESGAGKEVIARTLHDLSLRRSKPFLAINCAALTETLLESELFGHERGAFTGAVTQKKGKVEMAEGGTLFLDEIGELAQGLQAKLLRVLQEREFERVGGTRTIRLDIRLVAATNRDLRAEVKKGAFREDLYHRLNVISIASPPLRERPDDIIALALYFLERGARKVTGIAPDARQCLLRYAWPGNVRELQNAIERALVLGDSELLRKDDLPQALLGEDDPVELDFEASVSSAKRESILKAWAEADGDYRKAADLLGLHPNSLLRLLRKMKLRKDLKN